MKNITLLLLLSLILSSCSLLDDDKNTAPETPIITEETSIETEIIADDSISNDSENTDSFSWEIMNEDSQPEYQNIITLTGATENTLWEEEENISNEIEAEVSVKLDDDTESEEALNDVFNQIEELFELAEQNGGQ